MPRCACGRERSRASLEDLEDHVQDRIIFVQSHSRLPSLQLLVDTGCNQAHVTSTRPLALGASFSNAPNDVSRSSGEHPVHLSTTFKSTLLSAPTSASYRDALSIWLHSGLLLLFPPWLDEEPAASKTMCEMETMSSLSPLVSPHAPRPVP